MHTSDPLTSSAPVIASTLAARETLFSSGATARAAGLITDSPDLAPALAVAHAAHQTGSGPELAELAQAFKQALAGSSEPTSTLSSPPPPSTAAASAGSPLPEAAFTPGRPETSPAPGTTAPAGRTNPLTLAEPTQSTDATQLPRIATTESDVPTTSPAAFGATSFPATTRPVRSNPLSGGPVALQPGRETRSPQGVSPLRPELTLNATTPNAPTSTATAPEPDRDTTMAPDSATLGAVMLQSLLSQSQSASAPASVPAPASAASAPRTERLQEVIAATVSRVLVSDPLHDGRREVRIEIAHDVLPDTSIRLWREAGRLHVTLTSSSAVADSGLREALPTLAAAIQRQDPAASAPVVALQLSPDSGQPSDGRSRQRYLPEDPEETA